MYSKIVLQWRNLHSRRCVLEYQLQLLEGGTEGGPEDDHQLAGVDPQQGGLEDEQLDAPRDVQLRARALSLPGAYVVHHRDWSTTREDPAAPP